MAETVVETSVGDVKIKKVMCLHKKKSLQEDRETEVLVTKRMKSEQRGDLMRDEGRRMGMEKSHARGGKQMIRTPLLSGEVHGGRTKGRNNAQGRYFLFRIESQTHFVWKRP